MGDYAITKVILKVKEEYRKQLELFHAVEPFVNEKNYSEEPYKAFWKSVGIEPFYYQDYVFGCGSFHAYTTALGSSSSHEGSDFYTDDKYTTRYKDGLWFVEFSSKVGYHSEFKDDVLPLLADGWIGLYGNEYSRIPTQLHFNPELIVSEDEETQCVINNFLKQYNEEPVVEEDD